LLTVVGLARNTQIHCAGKKQTLMLDVTVQILTINF
jgi:hypothetical protein